VLTSAVHLLSGPGRGGVSMDWWSMIRFSCNENKTRIRSSKHEGESRKTLFLALGERLSVELEDEVHRAAFREPFGAADGDLDCHEPAFAAFLRKHRRVPGAAAGPRGDLDRAEPAPIAEFEAARQFVPRDLLGGVGGQDHETYGAAL